MSVENRVPTGEENPKVPSPVPSSTPRIPVLRTGYVRLCNVYGDELSIANAARASFDRESETFTEKDAKLVRYLVENGHTSPLRHAFVQLEVKAPLMVARQWWKHAVGAATLEEGSNWNESSRRYVTDKIEFYVPEDWRGASADAKQGSAAPLPRKDAQELEYLYRNHLQNSLALYDLALSQGACAEQARLFLPAYGMHVRWRWTPSVHALSHFLHLRLDPHAQWEIREYARATHALCEPLFPNALS
jgi:thymidylate synthase (FAD)